MDDIKFSNDLYNLYIHRIMFGILREKIYLENLYDIKCERFRIVNCVRE